MRINYQWLQDFVELGKSGVDVEEIGRVLTGLGLNVEEIQNLDGNFVLDVEVTTNRSDCLNHLGIAREIAAHYRLPLTSADVSPPENEEESTSLTSSVQIVALFVLLNLVGLSGAGYAAIIGSSLAAVLLLIVTKRVLRRSYAT